MQVDWGAMEFCYTPIVQSLSTSTGYGLHSIAELSTDFIAHEGVFFIAVGAGHQTPGISPPIPAGVMLQHRV
jgi:hypothetical protein